MRVLRIAQRVYPDDQDGGAYHVHALSRDQADLGHDITVLTLTNDPSAPRHEHRDGYDIIGRGESPDIA